MIIKDHGECTVCRGTIKLGQQWTITRMLKRVHANPDNCIAVLRPSIYKAFLKVNPHFKVEREYPVQEWERK